MSKAKIYYFTLQDEQTKEEKLEWFEQTRLEQISFEHVTPDRKHHWVNLTDTSYDDFVPLLSKALKGEKSFQSIFDLFSRGVETGRDEWVYDFSKVNLKEKIHFFVETYNQSVNIGENDFRIKWNSSLRTHADNGLKLVYRDSLIINAAWRPFTQKYFYGEKALNHRLTQNHYGMYGYSPAFKSENSVICCTDAGTQSPFMVTATHYMPDLHLVGTAAQCLPLYRYDENGTRIDNITDWALEQFRQHYGSPCPAGIPLGKGDSSTAPLDKGGSRGDQITKLDIFHYTYAVLHHPAYRTKYELNLKREFPRLPYYPNFHQWATWGKTLMNLHLTYETAAPYGLERIEQSGVGAHSRAPQQTSLIPDDAPPAKPQKTPKPKLKADKTQGHIILDTDTTLTGVPAVAWDYKLGNRSALEWILDQYKEKKPRDPTIRELFNTYRFADYKEHVIDLLQRVCTVSVETMHIIHQMPNTVEPEEQELA